MDFDAIILAGGRSSRLGGSPKSALMFDGATLLERSLTAAAGARHTVVVGPETGGLPGGVLSTREDPPFAGPAAAIAAGLAALRSAGRSDLVLVLACDMPRVGDAVGALLEALPGAGADGVMAASADGRQQPLAGFYSTAALERAVQDAAARNALAHGSVFALLASLDVQAVVVPAGSTDDVDTWDDAAALGVAVREQ
ncbi:NTP transferase domain-containing protein [Arthrobacter sp. OAP107]|uniref:molybdenum cofactor guanylyltransferase n=1 Tax=Arthrobacter sp. OAP107 TaxID=3156445 RepID=UPI00339A19DE